MTFLRSFGTSAALAAALGIGALSGMGCTGQLPGSFRLKQQEQAFSSQQEVNTKIDLLWVVDNSASMDISQEKLRKGFSGFARKYMQPTWDIRVAVITTDTYMAHPAFNGYLNKRIPGTVNWKSPYVASRLSTFVNPSWNPNLVNLSTGYFDSGVKYGELVPLWGPSYSRLLPGLHDGPITALCSELMPYFIRGTAQCAKRDDQHRARGTGTYKCLYPDTGAGETSVSECVNTVQNDTVRSGKAILSTMPPPGIPADAAWSARLVEDFMINVTTGSAGQGSERGLGSLQHLLRDNEGTETAFFRQGSLRGIIFVSDEEDQTMRIPETQPTDFRPQSYYRCDEASLLALNSGNPSWVNGNNGFCCSDPAKRCAYGSEGTSCASKTIDGYTYTVSVCAREDMLVPVEEVKDELDAFFRNLDGSDSGASSYFITSIVPLTAQAIQTMQAARNGEDIAVGAIKTFAVDRGDRYLRLGELVGNGSLAMNIADEDYSPILEAIGRAIVEKKGTFLLDRAPTGEEDMIVSVKHADGTFTVVARDQYEIRGKALVITDQAFILSLAATDQIVINYQPKTLY